MDVNLLGWDPLLDDCSPLSVGVSWHEDLQDLPWNASLDNFDLLLDPQCSSPRLSDDWDPLGALLSPSDPLSSFSAYPSNLSTTLSIGDILPPSNSTNGSSGPNMSSCSSCGSSTTELQLDRSLVCTTCGTVLALDALEPAPNYEGGQFHHPSTQTSSHLKADSLLRSYGAQFGLSEAVVGDALRHLQSLRQNSANPNIEGKSATASGSFGTSSLRFICCCLYLACRQHRIPLTLRTLGQSILPSSDHKHLTHHLLSTLDRLRLDPLPLDEPSLHFHRLLSCFLLSTDERARVLDVLDHLDMVGRRAWVGVGRRSSAVAVVLVLIAVWSLKELPKETLKVPESVKEDSVNKKTTMSAEQDSTLKPPKAEFHLQLNLQTLHSLHLTSPTIHHPVEALHHLSAYMGIPLRTVRLRERELLSVLRSMVSELPWVSVQCLRLNWSLLRHLGDLIEASKVFQRVDELLKRNMKENKKDEKNVQRNDVNNVKTQKEGKSKKKSKSAFSGQHPPAFIKSQRLRDQRQRLIQNVMALTQQRFVKKTPLTEDQWAVIDETGLITQRMGLIRPECLSEMLERKSVTSVARALAEVNDDEIDEGIGA